MNVCNYTRINQNKNFNGKGEEVGARHFLFLPIFLFLLPITLLDLEVEQSAQETAKN